MLDQWLEKHADEIYARYIALRRERGDTRSDEAIRLNVKTLVSWLLQALRGEADWVQTVETAGRKMLVSGQTTAMAGLESMYLMFQVFRELLLRERPEQWVEWLDMLANYALLGSQGTTKALEAGLEERIDARTREAMVFKTLVENSPDAIFTVDTDTRFTYANRSAYAIYGCDYESQDMIGWIGTNVWPEEALPFFRETVWPQALKQGWTGDVPQRRKDGTRFDASAAVFALRDAEGNPAGIAVILRDITERKQAEEVILQERNFSNGIIENWPGFFYMYDMQGRLVRSNKSFQAVMGYSTEELPEVQALQTIAEEDRALIAEKMQEVLAQGRSVSAEAHVLTTAGEKYPYYLTGFRVVMGEDVYLAGAGVDISERERAEAERERLQQEVIEAQRQALRELSTPIIPVMEGIIVMPLIGSIDTMRSKDIMRTLMQGISAYRAKVVILDITGVPLVDSGVADHLNKTIQAARLKGTRTIVTGVSDAVAETIVDLGIDWGGIETLRDLQTGLVVALGSLGFKLSGAGSL